MKRRTARKKFRAKLASFKRWLKENRATMTTSQLWQEARAKMRGHYAYYGVTDNSRGIQRFHREVRQLLYKWLNRRDGEGPMTWEKFALMERRFSFPKPRIQVSMFSRPKPPVQAELV